MFLNILEISSEVDKKSITDFIISCTIGSRKKVRAEKSSNRRKSRTFFLSNFFPPKFFWFIWKQRCYNNGRPLILKLVPNDEEWNDKISWFICELTKKIYLKVECYSSQDWLLCQNKSKHINKVGLSCAKLIRSFSWFVGLV